MNDYSFHMVEIKPLVKRLEEALLRKNYDLASELCVDLIVELRLVRASVNSIVDVHSDN